MHTMWKGSISFGLVNIPVKMFAATEDKDIRFKTLHKKCRTPIRQERVCPTCQETISPDDLVRGFEYEPGRFVLIDDEDLEAIKPATAKTAEILDFVDLREIDPIYFDKSYYLAPQENSGHKAYSLLCQAMQKTGRIAVAKITIRSKQSLAVIRVLNNILILETIFYPDEVRPVSLIPGIPQDVRIEERELAMAEQLIENLTTEFRPEKYRDEYREELLELIRKKAEGEEIVSAPEAPQRNVVDLMAALQASLQQTQEMRKQGKTPPGKERARKGKKQPIEAG
ncbi:MAG TPA: Ku protein [Thermoclostridium caenicola]|uniref:non-homologous end joining protein Ku n=1 Tax=Thermoclostridium caenicola TaxID=659425 RepID=UPI002B608DD4|nr:Ku protein [Thermoclostridium caenicola]HOK44031.1 Ku protein [Thermoclostridium caenicola]HOL85330.1 Ku protein [Thermoclostridium caenicola]HPO77427.1 Ku protein [Thermoclostridium caenicola]